MHAWSAWLDLLEILLYLIIFCGKYKQVSSPFRTFSAHGDARKLEFPQRRRILHIFQPLFINSVNSTRLLGGSCPVRGGNGTTPCDISWPHVVHADSSFLLRSKYYFLIYWILYRNGTCFGLFSRSDRLPDVVSAWGINFCFAVAEFPNSLTELIL